MPILLLRGIQQLCGQEGGEGESGHGNCPRCALVGGPQGPSGGGQGSSGCSRGGGACVGVMM